MKISCVRGIGFRSCHFFSMTGSESYPTACFDCTSSRRLFSLTFRTKMRGALRQRDLLDRRAAAPTRFSRSSVDAELVLHHSLQPGAPDVIANRGATLLDGAPQDKHDSAAQCFGLLFCNSCTQSCWMQARFEKRL